MPVVECMDIEELKRKMIRKREKDLLKQQHVETAMNL